MMIPCGNPGDHDSFQAPQRRAFSGLCLAIVQFDRQPGQIRIEARAEGLTPKCGYRVRRVTLGHECDDDGFN
ncbi:MAG: hypothetical protein IH624_01765 [Phycisphaerae bacterium]|nr:hypothetical protein [Phycisphaerae bacterium]